MISLFILNSILFSIAFADLNKKNIVKKKNNYLHKNISINLHQPFVQMLSKEIM